jgi:hypothetical protein
MTDKPLWLRAVVNNIRMATFPPPEHVPLWRKAQIFCWALILGYIVGCMHMWSVAATEICR